MRIRLEEALAYRFILTGERMKPHELMKLVRPDLKGKTSRSSVATWFNTGKAQSIKFTEMMKICEICKVTPNFLFGVDGVSAMLNPSEIQDLKRIIRESFDKFETRDLDKIRCWNLINISKKIGFDELFISELESDYKCKS